MASTSRKVSVKFDGEQSGLDRASKGGAKSLSRFHDGLDKISSAFRKTSKESDTAVGKVNSNLTKVDSQLKATRDRLDGLTKKFAETGDIKLFADMGRDTSLIKKLETVRKQIGDLGDDSAKGFVARFSGRIGPLMMSAPISPALITAVAAAAPAVSTIVGAAVTAGVAVGVTGIGAMLAAQDPAVQGAAQRLGETISADLKDATKPFVPAMLTAIDTVRREWHDLKPELAKLFADSAKYVQPLTEAAVGFIRNLIPGLREANKNAEPLIATLGEHGPKAAKALGDALATLSENSKQNATALDALLTSVEFGITSAATNINMLGKMLPAPTAWFMQWVASTDEGARKLKAVPPAAQAAAQGITGIGQSASDASVGIAAMMAKLDEVRDKTLTARSASRDYEAAIDTAAEAVKREGRAHADRNGNISNGTARGREYNEQLDNVATKTNAAYEATLQQTGSQEKANAVLATGRAKFLELADKMGMSSTAAKILADALFEIPSPHPQVSVETQAAMDAIKRVVDAGGKIKDIHRGIYYTTHGLSQGLHVPGGTILKDRWGGVHEGGYTKARTGLLRDAAVYGPRSPGQYMIAEQATGGEAFIPKRGNRRRSLSILDRAAGWYGTRLDDGSGGGMVAVSAPQPVEIPIYIGDEVVRVVRTEISASNRKTRQRVAAGSGAR